MVVGVNRRLAAERRAGKLAAAIGNHLVHVHVELRAAAGRPNMQREHVLIPARQNLVAGLRDQPMDLVRKPLAGMVGVGRRLFQDGVSGDHLARRQILADTEMLERTLGLRAPKLVGGDTDLAEGVGFYAEIAHLLVLGGSGPHRRITADMATEPRNVQVAGDLGRRQVRDRLEPSILAVSVGPILPVQKPHTIPRLITKASGGACHDRRFRSIMP